MHSADQHMVEIDVSINNMDRINVLILESFRLQTHSERHLCVVSNH